jgi:hypothetical protein
MPGEAREHRIAKVLGQDDWLFYAHRGRRLVFYSSESDWHWLETPHGGQAVSIEDWLWREDRSSPREPAPSS